MWCVAYLDARKKRRMAEDAQYAAQIDADVLFSRYYRGIAHMQAGGYEAAIADFTACVEDGVNAETARFWRGACYLDAGELRRPRWKTSPSAARPGVEEGKLPLLYGLVPHGAGGL